MPTTLPQRDPHLNESPEPNPVFGCITAKTRRDYKSLATTLANGLTLLADGYVFARQSDTRYTVESPKGEKYTIYYDPEQYAPSCSCPACVRLGTCKHIVALDVDRDEIDVQIAKREVAARIQAEAALRYQQALEQPTGRYWNATEAFFAVIDAKKIVAAVA